MPLALIKGVKMKYIRRIPLEGAQNFRDLGGYTIGLNHATKWGKIYRSDALCKLTDADWNILRECHIHTVIDLRNPSESKKKPIMVPDDVDLYHLSLMKELDFLDGHHPLLPENVDTILQSMHHDYCRTLFGNLSCAVSILSLINSAIETGSIVFMCSAGKDRTGIVAALILYLCGVDKKDIVADYMVSHNYIEGTIYDRINESLPHDLFHLIESELPELTQSKPETIQALLTGFRERKILHLLNKHGFTHAMQTSLKNKFTD